MIVANHKPGANIGESLVQMHVISAEQLQNALQLQKERCEKLSEILVSEATCAAAALNIDGYEQRCLDLKGRSDTIEVRVIQAATA